MVCNDMDGHDTGEIASQTVCDAICDLILNDGHNKDGIFTNMDFLEALDSAYLALDEKDNGAEKIWEQP